MFMVSWNINKQKQGAIIIQSLLLSYDNEIRIYYAFVANQMTNAHIMYKLSTKINILLTSPMVNWCMSNGSSN
jgi:hypothetical protein